MKPVPRCALKVLMALVKVHLHGIMPVLNETKRNLRPMLKTTRARRGDRSLPWYPTRDIPTPAPPTTPATHTLPACAGIVSG